MQRLFCWRSSRHVGGPICVARTICVRPEAMLGPTGDGNMVYQTPKSASVAVSRFQPTINIQARGWYERGSGSRSLIGQRDQFSKLGAFSVDVYEGEDPSTAELFLPRSLVSAGDSSPCWDHRRAPIS